jgi:hypothetical protein
VPEAEEGEAEAAVQYVEVLEDTEEAQANILTKSSLGAYNPIFQI